MTIYVVYLCQDWEGCFPKKFYSNLEDAKKFLLDRYTEEMKELQEDLTKFSANDFRFDPPTLSEDGMVMNCYSAWYYYKILQQEVE